MLLISRHNIGFPSFLWMLRMHFFTDSTNLYWLALRLPVAEYTNLYSPAVDALMHVTRNYLQAHIASYEVQDIVAAVLFYFFRSWFA